MLRRISPGVFVTVCIVASVASVALTAGCASTTPPAAASLEPFFHDAAFEPPSEPVDASDLFAVSPEMIRFLRVELAPMLRNEGRQRGLYEALQSGGHLRLDYDAEQTRNAAQAFHDRSGNCLSLLILSAALGRELGLQIMFQQVLDEENWGLAGDLVVVSGHVNLVLGQRNSMAWGDDSQSLTVDFLPSSMVRGRRARPISEATVRAMFQNNRAVEALSRGRIADAYWWARASLLSAPAMASSWNTLGVVYQRRGLPEMAEAAYRQVLQIEPDNLRGMANLVSLLTEQGRSDQALPLGLRLAALTPHGAPFHQFRLGLAAAQAGDWTAARDHLLLELQRDPTFPDAQVWLAQTYLNLGQPEQAQAHLALAAKHSASSAGRALYSAKLERLQALSVH